jgi:glycosyltransferase involved in cell wall biosynthesis
MRILLTTDPELRVPPELYGGIERIVAFLARGLVARGHHVTLFARADSEVPCEVVGWHGASSLSRVDTLRNLAQFTRYAVGVNEPYVIHSFARLAYLSPLLANRTPKIQSYQRYITPRSIRGGHALSRGTLTFTACSEKCARPVSHIGRWRVIHNGVDLDLFDYRPTVGPDAPLVFLGRIEPVKGTHHAIAIAKRSGRKLIIAGNVPERGPEADYARAVLAQCDGDRIRYIGPVNDAQKNDWLGTAAAMLFPIEWEEPFGIVMAEALACGTPVLALARGSVAEVVRDGETGFSRTTVDELATCVERLDSISRAACRRDAEVRFSSDVIVDQYEGLYRERLADC